MKLHLLAEATGRMRPATITMKRGTIINADHARWLANGKYLAVGIEPGLFEEEHHKRDPRQRQKSALKEARDFYAPPRWGNWDAANQDETGWSHPSCWNCGAGRWSVRLPGHFPPLPADGTPCCDNPKLHYNAGKKFITRKKFKKILTIRKENIANIEWSGAS